MCPAGSAKKTTHFPGQGLLLLHHLPSSLRYEDITFAVRGGEQKMYDIGRSLNMEFSNYIPSFGLGLAYLTARGNEAVFGLYMMRQLSGQLSDYRSGQGFEYSGKGYNPLTAAAKNASGDQFEAFRVCGGQPPDTGTDEAGRGGERGGEGRDAGSSSSAAESGSGCGGFICLFSGCGVCGNRTCGGQQRGGRYENSQERILAKKQGGKRIVVFKYNPCDVCRNAVKGGG